MALYHYRALGSNNVLKTGYVWGKHRKEARYKIEAMGLDPLSLSRKIQWSTRQKKKGVAQMFFYLDLLLKAKVPLLKSLGAIRPIVSRDMSKVTQNLLDSIQKGDSFSQALENNPTYFDWHTVMLVSAGEASGRLSDNITKLQSHLSHQLQSREKFSQLMVYPVFLGTILIGTTFFFAHWVVPEMVSFLEESHLSVPKSMSLLLALTRWDWVRSFSLILGGGMAIYSLYLLGKPQTILFKERLGFQCMPLKKLRVLRHYSALFSSLSTLLAGGVQFTQSLEIAGRSLSSLLIQSHIDKIAQSIKSGQTVSDAFKQAPWLPPIYWRLLSIGEETSDLAHATSHISLMIEKVLRKEEERILKILEPLSLVLLGSYLILLLGCSLLPLYQNLGGLINDL